MQVSTTKARGLALGVATGLAAAAVAATGAQSGGSGAGCADPGLLGAAGYRLVCLSSHASAPFLTEHTKGQYTRTRTAPQAPPGKSIPFMTEHTNGQYTGDRGTPQAVPSTFIQAGPSDGFSWADAAIGAGGAFGLVLLVAGAVVVARGSRARLASP